MKVILASKSPRRKELMEFITHDFEIIVSDADEKVDSKISAKENVQKIAVSKAKDVLKKIENEKENQNKEQEDLIVIASDTIVVVDGEILGKPKNEQDAKRMLRLISGREHTVMTGFCIIVKKDNKIEIFSDVEITYIYVDNLSDNEIEKWLSTGNAWDKAGAYAIQQEFGIHIKKIDGDYFSVVGLPINRIYNFIKNFI